jgi:hypothetical protein
VGTSASLLVACAQAIERFTALSYDCALKFGGVNAGAPPTLNGVKTARANQISSNSESTILRMVIYEGRKCGNAERRKWIVQSVDDTASGNAPKDERVMVTAKLMPRGAAWSEAPV